ncbi:MAG TPA: TRIC cation channel family protein [Actinomycetes bacterium]|nr:TRIC cation channel family protein [Actinomycetes bacterium]
MSAGTLATAAIQAQGVHIGGFEWTGDFTTIDLIAATTNALNGAILARRPDHYRNFTIVGVLLMALLGGIGGGVTRDVMLNKVPSALTNPAYILLCVVAGIIGYRIAFAKGQLFREGLFQFMTSFSLPWYAIAGAMAAEKAGLPVLGVLLLAVVGPTAGRYYIDVTSGVPPKQFVRGEWFVAIAALTGLVWILCDWAGLNTWACAGIAFVIGFTLRLAALYRGWEEPLAKEPAGAYQHSDGRPLLGRKLKRKSRRELRDLGLLIEEPDATRTDGSTGE